MQVANAVLVVVCGMQVVNVIVVIVVVVAAVVASRL